MSLKGDAELKAPGQMENEPAFYWWRFLIKSFQFVKERSCLSQQSHHGLSKVSLSHQYTGEVRSYRTTADRTPGQLDSGYELLSEVSKPTVTMAEFCSFGDYPCISASSGPKQRTWWDRTVPSLLKARLAACQSGDTLACSEGTEKGHLAGQKPGREI